MPKIFRKDFPLWALFLVFFLAFTLFIEGGLTLSTQTKQSIREIKPREESVLDEEIHSHYGIILFKDDGDMKIMEYQKNLLLPFYKAKEISIGKNQWDYYRQIQLPLKVYPYKITDDHKIELYPGSLSSLVPYSLFIMGISSYLIVHHIKKTQ